jgi:hypothetical protein
VDNLDIMLAARALEDMPAHTLALIDEKLNPFSEDEVAAQNAAKSKRKVKGYVDAEGGGRGRRRKTSEISIG